MGGLLGMAADLLAKTAGNNSGQLPSAAGIGTVLLGDIPFSHHTAGTRGQEQYALTQTDGLAHVVGDEHDGPARFLPDPLKFVVEEVAGDRIEAANGSSISSNCRS